ncbi:hypothetical protein [Kingella potus]|nr:hypothetical protein [Kingella potus]
MLFFQTASALKVGCAAEAAHAFRPTNGRPSENGFSDGLCSYT